MSARGQNLQGRKVLVKLLDGTKIVDIFKDNSSRHIILAEYGHIARDRIKRVVPYVEEGHVWATARPDEFDEQAAKEFPNNCPRREWVNGTVVEGLPGSTGAYTTACMQPLDKQGCCPAHGKVRYSVTEAKQDHQERIAKKPPALRHMPPRRKRGGKTEARMMYVRRVMGW